MINNLTEIERAFFCDSPFQVFTGMHMLIHDGIESDMYILDSFQDAKDLAQKLNQATMFRKTILIKSELLCTKKRSINKHSIISSFKTLSTYFRVESIVTGYLEKNTKYKKMYFTCNKLSFRLARFYYIKKGFDTEFVFFDEGAGSYDGHFENVKLTDRLIRTILFGKRSDNQNLKLFLYKPELYYDYENTKNRLNKIPTVNGLDVANIDKYRKVFDIVGNTSRKKCIFFDAFREEICFSKYSLNKLGDWLQLVENKIGIENMYIKSHPRSFGRYPHKCEEYATSSPMEINYMAMDLDDMCFVALISTATITPKMIYDREPYVILLCNVNHEVYKPRERLLEFFKNVQKLYRDPQKFMIPESEEELERCLNTVRNRINR